MRELLLTPQVRERAAALSLAAPHLAEMCDKLAQGIAVEGMESLAPVLADGMTTPLELIAGRGPRRAPGARAHPASRA